MALPGPDNDHQRNKDSTLPTYMDKVWGDLGLMDGMTNTS